MNILIGSTQLSIVRASLLEADVEAIVNAAHVGMRGGGGIDGAIHDAAGPELLKELICVCPQSVPVGTVIVTGGHRLPHRYVFHTPGPYWKGGLKGEPEQLRSCYHNCIERAHLMKLSSIGFCSISTGIYGYPLADAAPLALATVQNFLRLNPETTLRSVVFCMFGMREHQAFELAFS